MTVPGYPEYFESPGGRPIIATIGEVFDRPTAALLQIAAGELNSGLPQPRYEVSVNHSNHFSATGARLPEGSLRVLVAGSWQADKNLNPLWTRTEELKKDYGGLLNL
jgi:hypothetical protein